MRRFSAMTQAGAERLGVMEPTMRGRIKDFNPGLTPRLL
jgi:hypothetical protein